MTIALVVNSSKENSLMIAKDTVKFLNSINVSVLLADEGIACAVGIEAVSEDVLYKTSDYIVVIGGDGTIIHTAKKAAKFEKPVLGINAGRVGYLAGLERHELSMLEGLKNGDFQIENRMLLAITVGEKKFYSLNDAVVSKGIRSNMIDITATVGNESISYRADGLIAATPTGTTAYSLSAGGPIVDPKLESIILTPICPQSLFARPILLHSDESVSIVANPPEGTGAFLTIDGEESIPLDCNTVIKVTRAEDMSVQLIKLQNGMFLGALSEKFNFLK